MKLSKNEAMAEVHIFEFEKSEGISVNRILAAQLVVDMDYSKKYLSN